jgi:hypothetical protein
LPIVAPLKRSMSDEVRKARIELATAVRLAALFGYDDHVATHMSARLPDGSFLMNPLGLMLNPARVCPGFDELRPLPPVPVRDRLRARSLRPFEIGALGIAHRQHRDLGEAIGNPQQLGHLLRLEQVQCGQRRAQSA